MRYFARMMVFGGLFLFLLAAYSRTGQLTPANQVGDVLAMGTSLLAALAGLAFLLVTRGDRRTGETPVTSTRNGEAK